ncbi:tetratricopeptide repeat protein [Tamlana sp. 2201CG12-4]|uniref:tetratricopeptide repeat-containing sensor histidine kinase n=1 Tax=Tamlana sp. 2201CG12-4 TaxID=3112582 RepID=UPI002DB75C64|nr:tetratricopeptide repeat protein [Tamlana sp. 2201CG12-4]MEC3906006.1 tetratricopeptide repeat protein [Tamlana sp. 2201CG12-4]
MKSRTSFLFFYTIFYSIAIHTIGYSQVSVDSSRYYYNLILEPETSKDLIDAFIFFEEHKKKSLVKKDTLRAILDLRYIAEIQNKLGSLYDSENSIVMAMTYLKNLKGSDTLIEPRIGFYNQLGMLYRQFEDYEKSIEYYNKVLNLAQDPNHIASVNNNIANVYKEQKNYELAINEYKKIYKFYLEQGNTLKAARAIDNIGVVQSKMNHYKAEANLERALKMRIDLDYVPGIFTSYLHLAEHYKNSNENSKALFYAKSALSIANSSNNLKYKENALSILLDLKDDEEVQEYKALIDSINKSKQIQENKYAASKYEYNHHLKKAQESELQKERQKKLKLIYLFSGLSILLLSLFLFIYFRARHKKEKIKQVHNTETRISKKIHDEIANDMYNTLTKLETYNIKEEVLDELEDIYIRTRDISKENSVIDLKENYTDVLKDLFLSFKNDHVNIIARNISDINWDKIHNIKKKALYRVLQELLINMKKHSQASLVAFSFSQTRGKTHITYSDNGIGGTVKKSTGLLNVENRMQSINGTIIFESGPNNKGFKAKIII